MSSVDERIVQMKFDNAQFKKGAADTQKSLADLNKATDAAGKSRGLMDLSSNMEKVSVTASKMSVVVTTALATIANKATNVALSMASALTLDPIKQGFSEYEALLTKQNTIQNATGKSAKQVKEILTQLNDYSDKTIYNFGNMTDSVQKFVNAGVPLPRAVTSIKGIANAAAFAGASAEEANRGMYAFSQSMQTGFIMLQDWMQIENANMGTIQFKNELLKAGAAAGTLTKKGNGYVTASGKFVSATKGWRDGLQEQWATTEVLNKALGKYADENTKLGKKAFESAQEVRTFTAFMDTLKESLGSGWASIFTSLIGDLDQATSMWTGLSNAVGGAVTGMFDWLSTALKTWRTMGGFEKTMAGFRNLLAPIGALFSTIGTAFRAAFPDSGSGAGKGLYGLSAGFAALTSPLRILAWLIEQMVHPLTVVFMLFKIGGAIIRQLISWVVDLGKSIGDLFGATGKIDDGGFIQWLKDLGSWLVAPLKQISNLIDKGKSLGEAFKNINMPDLPSLPGLPSLPSIGGGGGDAVAGGASKATSGLQKAQTILKGFGKVLATVGKGIGEFVKDLFSTGDEIGSVFGKIGDFIKKIGDGIAYVFGKIDWENVLASFNLAVFATFAISMSRMFNAIADGVTAVTDFKKAGIGVLEQTGNALKSFQTQARAKLILNIAIAIGILAVSLWVLSKIPMGKLATSLLAMGAIFLMLNATMKSFTGLLKSLDGKKVGATAIGVSFAIAMLAGAMFIMAGALILFNYVKWGSIAKGMATMFVLMQVMQTLGGMMKTAAKNMIAGAFAISIISVSLLMLAGALIAFKLVDWGSMLKAGVVIAALTLALLALSMVPASTLSATGLAMLAISAGMIAMATALLMLALVKWESIGKLAVILAALAISLALMMAVGGPVAVSGMIGLGIGMLAIAAAALVLNKVNWSSIGKIALILTILTVALAAIGLVSYFVAPALILLGIAVGLLGVGLLAFASALAIAMTVAAAGTAAFAALGTGAALAIAAFLTSLALQAPIMKDSFLKILQALIDTIVEAVPMIIQGIKDLWKAIMKEFGGEDKKKGASDAGKSWLDKLREGIISRMPMIIEKAKDLAISFLKGLAGKADEIALMGVTFIVALVRGLAKKAGDIADAAVDLIIKFAEGISKGYNKILNAGVKLIAEFLHELASTIRNGSKAIGGGLTDVLDAMKDVGVDMVKGIIKGVEEMGKDAISAIGNLGKNMVDKAKSILKIWSPSRVFMSIGMFLVKGLTLGIQDNAGAAIRAVASMVGGQIAVANEYVSKFIQDLDQKAIAARAKADGLAAAAERAAKLAEKTKSKKDDKSAKQLQAEAEAAAKVADSLDAQAQRARDAQDRAEQFNDATSIEKARMRSEDAQNQLDAAKAAEQSAAKKLAQANALDKQAKAEGVTKAQRRRLRAEADALRAQAADDAKRSNDLLDAARTSAADALRYQKLAGDEAAKAFQDAFDADAKAAAEQEAFEKMSSTEKAALRRKQAAELQAQAEKDLEAAKKLAYTDLEAANELARIAQNEAEQARRYLDEADDLTKSTSGGGGVLGTVIDLSPTNDAAIAMRAHEDAYNTAVAAAAVQRTIEFNQYNTSPEALSPTEIYRQSNNLFTFAVEKIDEAAA